MKRADFPSCIKLYYNNTYNNEDEQKNGILIIIQILSYIYMYDRIPEIK